MTDPDDREESPATVSSDEVVSNHDEPADLHTEGGSEGREAGDADRDRSEPGPVDAHHEAPPSGGASMEAHRPSVEHFDAAEQALPGLNGLEVTATFKGPIPPPNILQGYENISPGFADRIIGMAEHALDATTEMDLTDRRAEAFALKAATVGVTFFPWIAIVCATILAVAGLPFAALLTGAAGLLVAGPQIIAAVRGRQDPDA